ncbi:MAG: hypothetical protein CM15mP84_03660 [Cellvibrionales bacterium]|nr:MAG: hypothetical protein CM15mP84_03660 [Cellvibrionales bacterium]
MSERDGKPSGWRAMFSDGQWVEEGTAKSREQSAKRSQSQGQGSKAKGLRPTRQSIEPPLAYANQCLYHADILISAWQHSAQNSEVLDTQVALAFAPRCSQSYWIATDGYSWRLVEFARPRRWCLTQSHNFQPCQPDWFIPLKWRPARNLNPMAGSPSCRRPLNSRRFAGQTASR